MLLHQLPVLPPPGLLQVPYVEEKGPPVKWTFTLSYAPLEEVLSTAKV